MKKIITSIIIAMTMVVSSFALDFSIGAKGVLSTNLDPESKVSFTDAYTNLKTNPVFDGGFGVFANFALLGGLGVQAEANFITSNVNFALEDNKVVDYESLVMDVPVMLWLNLPIWKLSLGLGAGVNFSTELNRSVDGSAGYVQQIKENQFKMGFVAGADFKIYFTKHLGLVMGGRYIIDFNKTTVPLVGDGDTGIGAVDELERPSIEFTRKNLSGGVGLEFKFF
ncbi:MAG: outer membrane beta-barrel protein [Treponema sp.]|nr:outer membrane beta-barrel protein [Treponema sp.]